MDGSPSRGKTTPGKLLKHVRHQDDAPVALVMQCTVVTQLTLLLGETIPIRLFLGGFDLTPTFREVNKKYSTRYYLSLVLIDEGTSMPDMPLATNFLFHSPQSACHLLRLARLASMAEGLHPSTGSSVHPSCLHCLYLTANWQYARSGLIA